MYRIVDFPKIHDPRGNLSFIEYPIHLPFEIKRVFWTYDVPGGESRGGHAYFEQEEIIIALSGSFDVVITHRDGRKDKVALNRSYFGLYIPPNTWRHMENFSTNSLGLHICSSVFNENDYIRDFEKYLNIHE
jgi:hypothetical protein